MALGRRHATFSWRVAGEAGRWIVAGGTTQKPHCKKLLARSEWVGGTETVRWLLTQRITKFMRCGVTPLAIGTRYMCDDFCHPRTIPNSIFGCNDRKARAHAVAMSATQGACYRTSANRSRE